MSGNFNLKTGKAANDSLISKILADSDKEQESQSNDDAKDFPLFVPNPGKRKPSTSQIQKGESVSGSYEPWKHHSRKKDKTPGPKPKTYLKDKVLGQYIIMNILMCHFDLFNKV